MKSMYKAITKWLKEFGKLKILLVLALIVLGVLGSLYMRYTWITNKNATNEQILKIAMTYETSLNGEMLKKLRAISEDKGTIAYESIKTRLINLRKINSDLRFAYIYTQRDGNVYFIADSEPVESKDYSPPGQEYTEASLEYKKPFEDGNSRITPSITDRWGNWVSVLVPMKDNETGKVIAVFGIDYPAKMWHNEAILHTLHVGFIVFAIFLLLVAFSIILIKMKYLKQERNFTEALLESIPGYLYVYDESGRLIRWNKKHEEMTGYTAEELSHMTLDKWFEGEDAIRVAAAVEEVFRTGYGEVEAHLLIKGGGKLHISSNGVRLNMGEKTYFTGVGIDITQRKKDEDALKESERQFRHGVDKAPIPIMLYAEDGEVIKISRTWTDITGYTFSDIPTTSAWEEKAFGIKKEEVQSLIKSLSDLDKTQNDGEFSVKTKDGHIQIWDFYSSYIGKLQDGRKMLMSVAIDVTERKRLEIALVQEKKLLETTMISVGDGVISTDKRGNIVFLNRVAEALTGWTQEEARGKSIKEVFNILNEFTREKSEDIVKKVLESGKILEIANHTILISKDGMERPIEDSVAPIRQENGEIVGVVLVFRDFSEKKQKQEEILYLSYHDKLTGLYNRRFYEEEIKRLDTERNLPISIIMGDVNGLKLVNDAFGHDKGDELLHKAAAAMRSVCRSEDIVARWGGDEFVILLPRTKTEEAVEIIKRIKNQYSNQNVNLLSVSISFGWETKKKADEDILKVLKSAEDYMYKHKIVENKGMRGNTISTIINTLHEKNPREEQHSQRVSEICQQMGNALGFSEIKVSKLKVVGLLHDIGKIAIEEGILNKPGKLTEQERNEIKRHPDIGYRILSSSIEMLEFADYILAHHERWDGTGYPKGLKGEAIPTVARIIALADSYDAMISERPYKNALSEEEVLAEIRKNAGTQFDPEIARVFIEKVLVKRWD